MKGQRFEIETFADLIEAAHATDDLDGLFQDLRIWTDIAVGVGGGLPDGVEWISTFVWTDDGERGMSGIRFEIQ